MPVQTAIWKVSDKPEPLPTGLLESERLLEEMIVADLRVLSDEWMLIGRQEDTGFGGRIDLLAVAPDGALVGYCQKLWMRPADQAASSCSLGV